MTNVTIYLWNVSLGLILWVMVKAKTLGNVGKMDNKGVEFSLNYHKNFSKDLGASFQANLTYNKKISWFIKTNRIILLFGSRKQENHIPD